MRLLIATDNTFYQTGSAVWDAFCFDRGFFDDYRAVFDEVTVAARVRPTPPPLGAQRADGDGVAFVPLRDVHGARWALAPMRAYCAPLEAAVARADAVCVRVPAVSGVFAARVARRLHKPLMFELVGDPLSLSPFGWKGRLFGRYLAAATRGVIRQAVSGSYVSAAHLQRLYPPLPNTPTEAVSSIRLSSRDIKPARHYTAPPAPLRLVLVASLFPYKNHDLLLRAMASARRRDASLHLDLVGEGPLRGRLELLATELEIASSVTFHGHVAGRERVNQLLDGSDLFVMPSLGEGLPRSMIEAMSRGLPCIGSEIPAIAELLGSDQRFSLSSPEGLARLLASAQGDPRLLNVWAEYSHRRVQDFRQEVLSQRRQRLLLELRRRASR